MAGCQVTLCLIFRVTWKFRISFSKLKIIVLMCLEFLSDYPYNGSTFLPSKKHTLACGGVHSFDKYLLNFYYVWGTVLVSRGCYRKLSRPGPWFFEILNLSSWRTVWMENPIHSRLMESKVRCTRSILTWTFTCLFIKLTFLALENNYTSV